MARRGEVVRRRASKQLRKALSLLLSEKREEMLRLLYMPFASVIFVCTLIETGVHLYYISTSNTFLAHYCSLYNDNVEEALWADYQESMRIRT